MLIFHKELNRLILPERRLLIGSILLSLLTGLFIIAQAYVLVAFISLYFPERQAGNNREFMLIAGFVGISFMRALSQQYAQKCNAELSVRIRGKLREDLYGYIEKISPLQIRSRNTAEWAAALIEKVDALDAYLSRYIPQFSTAVLIPLMILFMVVFTDWFSAIVLFITVPLIPLFMVLIGQKAEQLTRARWLSMTRLGGVFLDRIEGLMTLKYLGQSASQHSVIEKSTDIFARKTIRVLRVAFVSGLSLELIVSVSIALIAVETGLRLLSGMMDYPYALFVLMLAPEFYQPLRSLGASYHAGLEGATAMDAIAKIKAVTETDREEKMIHESVIEPPIHIRFKNVTFQFPGSDKPAIQGAGFSLLPNTINALIGPSGSGKTTVANLILKWLIPDSGNIVINGQLLKEISEEKWLAFISWIPQHPHVFHGTIRENIISAKPDASPYEIRRATEMASLAEWIAELPSGTDTMIGERGMKISQGQIQRIAIARAFLKDAPLMIFDEPANYLDPENERIIAGSVGQLADRKTMIVIAHRLKTAREAGHIVLLDQGRCVAEGTHEELFDLVPSYRKRFDRPAGG